MLLTKRHTISLTTKTRKMLHERVRARAKDTSQMKTIIKRERKSKQGEGGRQGGQEGGREGWPGVKKGERKGNKERGR